MPTAIYPSQSCHDHASDPAKKEDKFDLAKSAGERASDRDRRRKATSTPEAVTGRNKGSLGTRRGDLGLNDVIYVDFATLCMIS